MSSVDRQNKLLVAEDWKKIYQSLKNADFRSYDFDSLRRTMITYLRENYPEDFNDYIESSEYLALIDLISFLGQNLAFRFDLNARENFIELAERRESVLRLARLLSYSPQRTKSASGLLKILSVSTSETIIDSNGRNLSGSTIVWNDPTNTNWYEQFIKAINAALPEASQYGRPIDDRTIDGIKTQQYRFNSSLEEVPLFSFDKNIDGRNMSFEIVSSSFKDADKIYEEAPRVGNKMAFIYRDDGRGASSSNTGFFMMFKQGSLKENNFNISSPSPNETVDVESININNDDVWLYELDDANQETDLWKKVDSVVGNNVIYNSLSKNERKIYTVLTRTDDKVRLIFSDGTFGDLPKGRFKLYYRTAIGLTYSIDTNSIKNVTVSIPYLSRRNKQEVITLTLSLTYNVTNATETESTESIKNNAPSVYYTQNRMITGEDYNLVPISTNQEILKSKAVNRTSSGISRFFDLKDTTGKYSNTNIFANDGILYREEILENFRFKFDTLTDIEAVLIDDVEKILSMKTTRDFYLSSFPFRDIKPEDLCYFYQVTDEYNRSTGVLIDTATGSTLKLGDFTSSIFRSVKVGSMLKFVPPDGKLFSVDNKIIDQSAATAGAKKYIWVKVVNVVGDGTAGEDYTLSTGLGPIVFNESIPTDSILSTIVPPLITVLSDGVKSRAIELIFARREFGLRYDQIETTWSIITSTNINKNSRFNLGKSGDQSGTQQDASWVVRFETDGDNYVVSYRGIRYVFESEQEVRFFFDSSDKIFNLKTGKVIKDKISILDINTLPEPPIAAIENDLDWEITEDYKGADGYIDTKKISVSFFDSDDDGVVDDPSVFDFFVAPNVNPQNKIIFQENRLGPDGVYDFYYYPQGKNLIQVFTTQEALNSQPVANGALVYVIEENSVKRYIAGLSTFIVEPNYRGLVGRNKIKFQYIHNASDGYRLDPSTTNIIDIYILTKNYETEYGQWIKGELENRPLPPSTDSLYINFSSEIEKNKSISDEIVYHSVKFKNIFGSKADSSLQATFKVTKNESLVISDSEIKSGIVEAINEFFSIENWDFGDTFYFSELATYVMMKMAPRISNIVIVPKREDLAFGSLQEIKSNADEIFSSSCTVDDIEIIQEITATKIKSLGPVLTAVIENSFGITSR
jgi:hypothetical protein